MFPSLLAWRMPARDVLCLFAASLVIILMLNHGFAAGVVLFAKAKEVVAPIHSQFRQRVVKKQYLAITVGVPPLQHFSADAPIDKDPEHE